MILILTKSHLCDPDIPVDSITLDSFKPEYQKQIAVAPVINYCYMDDVRPTHQHIRLLKVPSREAVKSDNEGGRTF